MSPVTDTPVVPAEVESTNSADSTRAVANAVQRMAEQMQHMQSQLDQVVAASERIVPPATESDRRDSASAGASQMSIDPLSLVGACCRHP